MRLVLLLPVIILGAWVAIGPYVRKKRLLLGLDERERLIYEKAKPLLIIIQCKMEQGNYTPSLTLALKIARTFGKSVEEVFWLEG